MKLRGMQEFKVRKGIAEEAADSAFRLTKITNDLSKEVAESSAANGEALSVPVLACSDFQIGPSSGGRVTASSSSKKNQRRRPPSWKRKTGTRPVDPQTFSTQVISTQQKVAESSPANGEALSAPVLACSDFQMGHSSGGRVTASSSSKKNQRRRPPSWKRKTGTRPVDPQTFSTQSDGVSRGRFFFDNRMVGKEGVEDEVRKGWLRVREAFTDHDAEIILRLKPNRNHEDGVCNCGIETICHLLFTCPMAKDTWERSANSVFLNIYHLLEKSKKFPKNLNVNSFPWILWHLWKARNGLTFERIQYSSVSVVTRAKEEANVWFEVNFPGAEVSQIPHTIRDNFVSWSKHPTGFLKCNVGISWVSRHVNCGVAWILRDNKGKAILHSRRAFSNVESQRDAELIVRVREVFTDHDAEIILRLKPNRNHEDGYKWGFTKNGEYSSRSGLTLRAECVTVESRRSAIFSLLVPWLKILRNGLLLHYRMQASLLTLSSSTFITSWKKSKKFPKNLNVNSFPWILWHLWKARNGLTFERIQFSSVSVVTRAKEEANVWFEVNFPRAEVSQIPHTIRDNFVSWSKHPTGFLKCNVGISWVSRHVNCGVAWILRDNKGKAILHSRRAFSNVESQRDAELIGLQWGVKYMVNTHQRNIIFDSSCALARDTFLNIANYMEHVLITNDIKYMLCSLQDWSFHHSDQRKNTIAQDIAASVTSERRYQSYIAFGAPS
ncbi:hypothetical protein F2Q68_00020587 [Brassica cretica]|uniref:RNase H type-1 domain-containing protein n=1 Tax=Brassica cretica TaxID=69181 RepID=A0A8S9FQ50_BRACR|nr:hypothetical protein F2Q68_00020587 [Brassica cretica]